jgi:hypothetical protein
MRWGYASYNTVCLAMRYEVALLSLTNTPKETVRNAYGRYIGYYDRCLDPAEGGSLANIRSLAEQRVKWLEDNYPPRTPRRDKLGEHRPYKDCGRYQYWTVVAVTEGSLERGWTGRLEGEDFRWGSAGPCNGRGPNATPFYILINSSSAQVMPYDSGQLRSFEQHLADILAHLREASAEYAEQRARVALLRAAEQNVDRYRKKARELMNAV